jgi:hypothetical protein
MIRGTRSRFAAVSGDAAKQSLAQRGKRAEADLRKYLELVARKRADFVFERRYDARSAGGRFPSQAGDYGFYCGAPLGMERPFYSINGLIEVKEVDHDYRLPQKNFSDKRINRCTLREHAGSEIYVLVLHTTTHLWRTPPFAIFRDDPTAASWDLSAYPTFDSIELALRSVPSLKL